MPRKKKAVKTPEESNKSVGKSPSTSVTDGNAINFSVSKEEYELLQKLKAEKSVATKQTVVAPVFSKPVTRSTVTKEMPEPLSSEEEDQEENEEVSDVTDSVIAKQGEYGTPKRAKTSTSSTSTSPSKPVTAKSPSKHGRFLVFEKNLGASLEEPPKKCTFLPQPGTLPGHVEIWENGVFKGTLDTSTYGHYFLSTEDIERQRTGLVCMKVERTITKGDWVLLLGKLQDVSEKMTLSTPISVTCDKAPTSVKTIQPGDLLGFYFTEYKKKGAYDPALNITPFGF